MTSSWALAVAREELSRTELFEGAVPQISRGEALLRIDRVAVTANNVTYAALGTSFHYWDFFPANPGWGPGWGQVPLWGFAEVAASAADNVEVGGRVYGRGRAHPPGRARRPGPQRSAPDRLLRTGPDAQALG